MTMKTIWRLRQRGHTKNTTFSVTCTDMTPVWPWNWAKAQQLKKEEKSWVSFVWQIHAMFDRFHWNSIQETRVTVFTKPSSRPFLSSWISKPWLVSVWWTSLQFELHQTEKKMLRMYLFNTAMTLRRGQLHLNRNEQVSNWILTSYQNVQVITQISLHDLKDLTLMKDRKLGC